MKISRRATLLATLLACLGPAVAAPAGAPHQLVDANPGPLDYPDRYVGYQPPTRFTTLQGRGIFLVDSESDGLVQGETPGPRVTLWASDGTAEGTELLATFCADGVEGCYQGARFLGQARGVEFLAIPERGYDLRWELWRTDGTVAGTFRLPTEVCASDPYNENGATEAIAGGVLYFPGLDAATGCKPWRSDGTVEGTGRLGNRRPGAGPSRPYAFATLGDRVFFATEAGLWTVDVPAGALRLLRAALGVRLTTAVGSRLFFLSAAEEGEILWVSDGEAGGDTRQLHLLREVRCRDCDLPIQLLKPLAGGVVFLVTDPSVYQSRLWRSDGTERGTYQVVTPHPLRRFGNGGTTLPEVFAETASGVLFTAADKEGTLRLWTAGPLPEAAAPLAGCSAGCPFVTSPLLPLPGGRVVLTGGAAGSPAVLWVSDGTAAGTRPLSDPCQGSCSAPFVFLRLGDAVYFSLQDDNGPALWRTDGTRGGTVLLARMALPFRPGGALLGNRALLGGSSGARIAELWSTDGTPAGTLRVRTFGRTAPSSDPGFAPLGGGVLFVARQGSPPSLALWGSDGVSARKLADLCPGPCYQSSPLVTAGGLAFVLAGGVEEIGLLSSPHLFRTDGSPEGNREILALDFDSLAADPFPFAGKLFFLRCGTAEVPGTFLHRCAFWSSDGTPEGTAPRVSLPLTDSVPPPLVTADAFYFFLFGHGGISVYRSDGTQAGTRRLASFDYSRAYPLEMAVAGGNVFIAVGGGLGRLDPSAPDGVDFSLGSFVSGLRELGGRLLFFGHTGGDSGQTGLWSTDGTQEGTRLLSPVLEQSLAFDLNLYGTPQWTRLGSRLLFRGWDPEHGFELWATDGTPEGTVLLRDAIPGPGSSFPDSLVQVGDRVWLTLEDGVHGRELWVTDGTPEGTRLAVELAPGPFSLLPRDLTAAGSNLFFSAHSLFTGREPWVLPLQ